MLKISTWLQERLPIQKFLGINYLVPKNLNIWYCFGVLAVFMLANQIITGIWLSMFYTPTVVDAFSSIQIIMRDINYGWLFRYMHTTGASLIYIVLYLHIFRGLLYGSYQKPRELVWLLGVLLFIAIIAESTFGYLLPWGQMSYWSMQVITSILSVIPYIGEKLVIWARGDFVVSGATLQRCYALHIIGMPLIIFLLVFLHITALQHVGGNNPSGVDIKPQDKIPFYPHYMLKDLLAVLLFLTVFFTIVFYFPDMGGYFIEKNNYTIANSMQSPADIKPLWYLMPFYGILKIIPNKALGVIMMLLALGILFFLPWLDKSSVRTMRDKGIYSKIALACFLLSFVGLGFTSMQELTLVNLLIARFCLVVYFASIFLMPVYTKYENCKQSSSGNS